MNLKFDVKVIDGTPAMKQKGMLARATVTMVAGETELIRLNEILIRNGTDGPWVAYPSKKDPNGKVGENGKPIYYKTYQPFPDRNNSNHREALERAILAEYNNVQGSAPAASVPSAAPNPAPAVASTNDQMIEGIDFSNLDLEM